LRLKILKKLRTASLNSEITGSYIEKSVTLIALPIADDQHFTRMWFRYFALQLLSTKA